MTSCNCGRLVTWGIEGWEGKGGGGGWTDGWTDVGGRGWTERIGREMLKEGEDRGKSREWKEKPMYTRRGEGRVELSKLYKGQKQGGLKGLREAWKPEGRKKDITAEKTQER